MFFILTFLIYTFSSTFCLGGAIDPSDVAPTTHQKTPRVCFGIDVNCDGIGDLYVGWKMLEHFRPYTAPGTAVLIVGLSENSPHYINFEKALKGHYNIKECYSLRIESSGESILHCLSYHGFGSRSAPGLQDSDDTNKMPLHSWHLEILSERGRMMGQVVPSLFDFSLGFQGLDQAPTFLCYDAPTASDMDAARAFLDESLEGWNSNQQNLLLAGFCPKIPEKALKEVSESFPEQNLFIHVHRGGKNAPPETASINEKAKILYTTGFLDAAIMEGLDSLAQIALVGGDTSLMKALSRGAFPIVCYTSQKQAPLSVIGIALQMLLKETNNKDVEACLKNAIDYYQKRGSLKYNPQKECKGSLAAINFDVWRQEVAPLIVKYFNYAEDSRIKVMIHGPQHLLALLRSQDTKTSQRELDALYELSSPERIVGTFLLLGQRYGEKEPSSTNSALAEKDFFEKLQIPVACQGKWVDPKLWSNEKSVLETFVEDHRECCKLGCFTGR
ncbi:hypothetical protein OAN22_01480 [Alphaproteobacteria bacterium]|nr:hypothetical protein [Alphaproteobacteria bacterium]